MNSHETDLIKILESSNEIRGKILYKLKWLDPKNHRLLYLMMDRKGVTQLGVFSFWRIVKLAYYQRGVLSKRRPT